MAELIKHTPASHPDHENLKEALAKIKEVTKFIDSKAQETANVTKLFDHSGVNIKDLKRILGPMRQWLHTGTLSETMTKDGKNLKSFKALLFSDLILLTIDKRKKGLIYLKTVWVNDFPKSNVFGLFFSFNLTQFFFCSFLFFSNYWL